MNTMNKINKINKTINNAESQYKRYMECYIDDKEQVINHFNPILYITQLCDVLETFKKNIFICNKEPYCDCSSASECDCDDDNYSSININLQFTSGCMCNLTIKLCEKYKLKKNFTWHVFGLQNDTETSFLNIDTIENKIKFMKYGSVQSNNVEFLLDDPIKVHNNMIDIRFNYMHFSDLFE